MIVIAGKKHLALAVGYLVHFHGTYAHISV